jgi:hypothetical protein
MRIGSLATLTWILGSSAFAQGPASDCLIDQISLLPSFEALMGYKIDVAQDGTEFTAAEKIAFNQVAVVLPGFYRHLNTLHRFERVPNGYVILGGAVGEYSYRGFAGRGRGQIELAQRELKTEQGRFAGEFHWNIIHEMTHALDQSLRNYSHSDEWTGLSTWGEDGKGTSKNFVTWYAPYGPDEDFAESMTAFVIAPDELLRVAPAKFDLISRKFYGGRRYDLRTLEAKYAVALSGLDSGARAARIHQLRQIDYYACKLLEP